MQRTYNKQHSDKNEKKQFNLDNLLVYQKSVSVSVDIIKYFSKNKFQKRYEFLILQLLRSASSIGANIAEGFGRHYIKSYRQFLSISRGSCFETTYWLDIAINSKLFNNKDMLAFKVRCEEIIRMLTVMMKKLERKT